VIPSTTDTETEKLIREKDEEVQRRHSEHEPEQEHSHDEHSDRPLEPNSDPGLDQGPEPEAS
jgi:hypothetical protein